MLTETQRLVIKTATFLATVLVVLRHGQNLHLYYENGSVWMPATDANIFIQEFISRFSDLAIPFFFMLSGFLYFLGTETFSQIKEKNIRRIHSLLIPFLLWNILEIIFWGGLSFVPALHDQMIKSFGIDWSFLWILKKITIEPMNGPFWYIRTLIIFCALSPAFLIIFRHKLISLMIFGLLMRYWMHIDCGIFSTEGLACFFLGGMIGYNKWHEKLEYREWVCPLLFVAIGTLISLNFFRITFSGAFYLRIFLSVVFLIQFSLWSQKSASVRKNIGFVSSKSFFLYAIHGDTLAATSVLLSRYIPHTPTNSLLLYFTCSLTIILCSLLAAHFLQKIFPKGYSLLTGGRGK